MSVKRLWIVTVYVSLAFMLLSCSGNVTITSEQGIAFVVFQLIPEEDIDVHFHGKDYTCPKDCTRHFGDEVEYNDYGNHGKESFAVDCFPMDGGGWLAVLSWYGCLDYCSYGQGKAYVYKNGVLNEAPDMLPMPLYEGEELAQDFYRRHCDKDKLYVAVAGFETDEWGEEITSQETTYKWDGKRFVELSTEQYKNETVDTVRDTLPADDAEGVAAGDDGEEEKTAPEIGQYPICDMEALYKALCDKDEMYRDYESQVTYAENSLHGWTFSRMDAYSASLDVSCTPFASDVFKVVATVKSIEDGEESSYTEIYWYKDGVLFEYDDDE